MAHYNSDDFASYFNQFALALEKRRSRRKALFTGCSITAVLLVVLLPWYVSDLTEFLNQRMIMAQGDQWKEHASASDRVSVAVFIIAISIFLVLWPIFSYRGSNKAAGLVPRDYSFKDYVYSHLLNYFGDFQFAPEGGMLALDVRKATIIPSHQLHTAEDYIKGILHECTVKIAETEIANVRNKEHVAIFKGLLIIIDVCDIRVKLRGTFSGKTVLIADAQKDIGEIAAKYASYQRFHLTDTQEEETFEAFTTNAQEAQRLLSPTFIKTLLTLQTHLSHTKEQYQHWDDKIAHIAQAILDRIKLPFGGKSAAEKAYDELHDTDMDVTKENAISMEPQYINRHVQAEFYDDKLIITLPFKHDLFETNSLFEPAIHDEDRIFLFTLMQGIEQITEEVRTYFSSK